MRGGYFLLFFSISALLCEVKAQTDYISISGYVLDQSSKEALPIATIVLSSQDKKTGVIANAYGFYTVKLRKNTEYYVCASYLGYNDTCLLVSSNTDTLINFNLEISPNELKTVEVNSESRKEADIKEIYQVSVNISDIEKVPAFMGEPDVLKMLHFFPQVQGGLEGMNDLFVRGGDHGENMVLLDGVPVYNLSHAYGLFSLIDPFSIKSLDFYPGIAPAQFGGRLSSYTDIKLKEGNLSKYEGHLGVGTIMSRIGFQGPIIKDRSAFHLSLRRSYIDAITGSFLGNDNSIAASNLTDAAFKYHHKIDKKNTIYLSGYLSEDNIRGSEYYVNSEADLNREGWGNRVASLRWTHVFNTKLHATTNIFYSDYRFSIRTGSDEFGKTRQNYDNSVTNIGAQVHFDFFASNKHSLNFGGRIIQHQLYGPELMFYEEDDRGLVLRDTNYLTENYGLPEFMVYIEDRWRLSNRVRLHLGVNVSSFSLSNSVDVQPRAQIFYQPNSQWTLSTGYSRNTQYLHQLRLARIQLPGDLWVGSGDDIQPSNSDLIDVTVSVWLPYKLKLKVSAYQKWIDNSILRVAGQNLMYIEEAPKNYILQGQGRAQGIETSVEKRSGSFTGLFSYTLSRAMRQSDDLNFGNPFPFDFDRRHSASIMSSYNFGKNFEVSLTAQYASGLPLQFPLQQIPSPWTNSGTNLGARNDYIYYISERNNFRLPDFFLMNASFVWRRSTKKGNENVYTLTIYNMTNQVNPFDVYFDPYPKYSGLLPIMPFFSYMYKF